MDQVQNFIKSTVNGGHTAGDTTISVTDATTFPDPASGQYNVTWHDSTNYPEPTDDPNVEIVRVTARDTGLNTVTVTRAQEGTTATTKNTGGATYVMRLTPTKKTMDEKVNRDETDASGFGFVVDEDDMVSNSALLVPTQQSVKAYVDASFGAERVRLRKSTGQSLTNNVVTILTWETEDFDTDTMHDPGDNTKITLTTAGTYLVLYGALIASNATGYRLVQPLLNGATALPSVHTPPPNGTDFACAGSFVYTFSASDYIQLRAYQNSGGALNFAADQRSYFSAIKLF